jgi:probable F420-dependent oxidoreductase
MPSFGVVIPSFGEFADPETDRALVEQAEELGYDHVWYGDHIVIPGYAAAITSPDWLEPIARCTVNMARTTRVRFGTEVLVAPYRNPLLVAKMAATADHLCGGRLTLAFGVGYLKGEFAALGAPPFAERGAVTDEHLEVIRALWDATGPVGYDGRYVQFSDVRFGPAPTQDPVPLWVGGNAPRALRRAARLGNGWHPLFPTPEAYAAARKTILELRGDAPGDFAFSYSAATTKVLDDPDGPYQLVDWSQLEGVPDDFDYAPTMPTTPSGRPYLMGTPDQLVADVAELAAAGVEHIALRFATGGPETTAAQMSDQMQRFAREVVPRATDAS